MALRPLDPAPKLALGDGWELIAAEAGRSSQGLRASVHLVNGTAQACQTLALGDVAAQQALVGAFASITGMDPVDLSTALAQLAGAVESVLRQQASQDDAAHSSQATRLVTMALDADATLFHTSEGEAYVTIAVEDHRENWPLQVKGFRRWLARQFYQAEEKTPGA